MKKYLISLIVLGFLAGTSCQEKIDIEKEKEAIKAVIEGEIKASFDGDYETWTTFFVHEPYTFWLQASQGGYSSWKGWEEISSNVKDFIKPDRAGSVIHEGNYDYTIRVYKEAALVTFKSKITFIEEDESFEGDGIEVRSMEKQDGEWKITYLGTVRPTTYEKGRESEDTKEAEPETEETE
jgi:hypothetical protein